MSLEQLALLGIGIFGFIAIMQAFATVRGIKRSARKRGQGRYRRPVAADAAARSIAEGLVREVIEANPATAEQAMSDGKIPSELETALEQAQAYYRERVETRHRALFHEAVNKILLKR